MPDEITAILIIEVLGRPAEHVATALEQLIERLGKEQELQVTNKKIYEPKQTEKTQNMFLAFAEIEIKVKNLARLAEICFAYMPSSVEIIQPYDLKMTLNDANAILNLLVARLHGYDSIAKRLTIENAILQNQLRQAGIIKQQISPQAKIAASTKIDKKSTIKARKGKSKTKK